MKVFHIVCMVLMIAMMQHTCLAETMIIDQNNTKEWDAENKTITIFNEDTKTKLMTVKLISARPDLCTFTEVYEVSNFEVYTPGSQADFKARTNTVIGSGAVTNTEWFIEQNVSYVVNVTEYGIKQHEEIIFNNKTGKNETVLVNKTVITGYHDEIRYRDVWVDYQPYNKEMSKNAVQRIKVVYHKIPELGPFQIQTIPMFRGIECKELTWWSGSWDRRRPILINNTGGDSVTDFQLISTNLSSFNINAASSRIVNNISGLEESFWNETVDVSGNLEYVWCNYSSIPSGGWINSTYDIYYQSVPTASGVSDGDLTFLYFDDFGDGDYLGKWTYTYGTLTETNGYLDYLPKSGYYTSTRSSYSPGASDSWVLESKVLKTSSADSRLYLAQVGTDDAGGATPGIYAGDIYGAAGNNISLSVNDGTSVQNDTSITRASWANHDYIFEISKKTNSAQLDIYEINRTRLATVTDTTHVPDITNPFGFYGAGDSGAHIRADWFLVRKGTTNEPEPWTVGAEEEYVAPTPTPTPAPTTPASPAQYDELDFPLILYILTISMLYLLIAFKHGIAAAELSLIYLIFAFFFLLFQTITISVNYIYLTLFLLLFLISIAGITKQGVD